MAIEQKPPAPTSPLPEQPARIRQRPGETPVTSPTEPTEPPPPLGPSIIRIAPDAHYPTEDEKEEFNGHTHAHPQTGRGKHSIGGTALRVAGAVVGGIGVVEGAVAAYNTVEHVQGQDQHQIETTVEFGGRRYPVVFSWSDSGHAEGAAAIEQHFDNPAFTKQIKSFFDSKTTSPQDTIIRFQDPANFTTPEFTSLSQDDGNSRLDNGTSYAYLRMNLVGWTSAEVPVSGHETPGYILAFGAISPDGERYVFLQFIPKGAIIPLGVREIIPSEYAQLKGYHADVSHFALAEEAAGAPEFDAGVATVTIDDLYQDVLLPESNAPYAPTPTLKDPQTDTGHFRMQAGTVVNLMLVNGADSDVYKVISAMGPGKSVEQAKTQASSPDSLPLYTQSDWTAMLQGKSSLYVYTVANNKAGASTPITFVGNQTVTDLQALLNVEHGAPSVIFRLADGTVVTVAGAKLHTPTSH